MKVALVLEGLKLQWSKTDLALFGIFSDSNHI